MTRACNQGRRLLLKGGALTVGFSLFGAASAVSPGPFPGHVPGPVPDLGRLDSWIVIHPDNSASLLTGRSELGQGGVLGLLQIAAEELDLSMRQIRSGPARTGDAPETGETDASSSIEMAGKLVRQAAAEARSVLLGLAAARLGVSEQELRVVDGVVHAPAGAASVTYGELIGERRFDLRITGKARAKPVSAYRIVGQSVPRLHVREKVTGQFTYVQGVTLPGMLHGRVVRPRGQGVYGQVAPVLSIDAASIDDIPGVRIVRKGNFVGVVADKEWHAVKAAAQLKVSWGSAGKLPGNARLYQAMRAAKTTDSVILTTGEVGPAFDRAACVVAATYHAPYQAHAPFAPNCAVADVRPDSAAVSCATQGIYVTRMEVAKVIGMSPEQVTVTHVEGSGTYGPSCYHDVAQAAAIMSQAVGRPVRVQFMRWDEFGWDNYGPAHLADVKIAADRHGKLLAYQYDGWQHGWIGSEMSHELALGTKAPYAPSGPARVVNKANAGAMYAIPGRRLNNHHISASDGFLRGNPLRSPVDLAISFASEQTIDEVAHRLRIDPAAFRRANIEDARWRGVLEAVVKASRWEGGIGKGRKRKHGLARGRGIALGTHFVSYGAAVADVEVNLHTGVIRILHVWGALDAGLVVNPGLVEAQIVGMLTQASSRMLKEEVTFSEQAVTSLDWMSYPVLRFDEHPGITPIVVQRTDQPSTGAGEEAMGAAAGAIANAVFDAIGVRLRQFPMTPERVKAAVGGKRTA